MTAKERVPTGLWLQIAFSGLASVLAVLAAAFAGHAAGRLLEFCVAVMSGAICTTRVTVLKATQAARTT